MNLRQIDLNLLVALEVLLEERSVTRAGRRLHLSQPATSAALGRLRELFRDPLLERVGNDYRLTPLAAQLVGPLREILSSIERTLELGSDFEPSASTRRFRIAITDDVLSCMAQPIVERVAQAAPKVKLHFSHVERKLVQQLTTRLVDIAIRPLGMLPGFASEKLFDDSWTCALWRDHPDVGTELTREQFMHLPHASYSFGRENFTLISRLVGPEAERLHVPITSENIIELAHALRGTRLIAVIPRRIAARVRATAELRFLAPPLPLPAPTLAMYWSPSSTDDPGHAWLRGILTEAAATMN